MEVNIRVLHLVEYMRSALLALAMIVVGSAKLAAAPDPITYALCDVRVVYLYDEADPVDWPTLYYLNDLYGCRIDLLQLRTGGEFRHSSQVLADRQMGWHQYFLPTEDTAAIQRLVTELWGYHPPDLVLQSRPFKDGWQRRLIDYLVTSERDSAELFSTSKVYEFLPVGAVDQGGPQVVLNPHELFGRYRDRLELEVPQLLGRPVGAEEYSGFQVRYVRRFNRGGADGAQPDFLSGLQPLRLTEFIDKSIPQGPMRRTFLSQAHHYLSSFRAAQALTGSGRADKVIDGFRQMQFLTEQTLNSLSGPRAGDLQSYLLDLAARAEQAALATVGIAWDGRIVVLDTPHGPRVKFRLSLSANGPSEVVLETVRFRPHWDSVEVVLDDRPRVVSPHQSYVREFLVDVEPGYLETQKPESLAFVVGLSYGAIPLQFERSLPLRRTPTLTVSFDPDYVIVPPVSSVDIDRLIGSSSLDVVITKASEYAGPAYLELTTPRGVFAGAYRQTLDLEQGQTRRRVRIPFTTSNLMEIGRQMATIALSVDNQVIAVDTAMMRIARCRVADTLTIGFVPDSSGRLEDALRMTNADFRPLTDRSLLTADLAAYSVIIIGSGSHRGYPSLSQMTDRFEEYVRYGGSLVILGQEYNWPRGILPVSLVPAWETLGRAQIITRLPQARVLSRPHEISAEDLLSAWSGQVRTAAADVAPAEVVITTASGAALLSISRLGTGQVIYCGLPLLEMVSQLNLEAIHLLANILNY
ncbi:MAG: hypothetical protein ABIE70_07620 [bacterium]